ncbi:MAG: VIT family protein [Candidatus Sphingomonas colombiensis]|nr:VIT family protein [Sphingomonas sp.]WEK43241.1 MAG: VIT family protein [Sphingomonas sp.]
MPSSLNPTETHCHIVQEEGLSKKHAEQHLVDRIGWLRAAVLGANDGIVSVGSLIIGVAAAATGRKEILVAGCAAWIAGSMSMAAGEYVSVSSQADAEAAALTQERSELQAHPVAELRELAGIYVSRGLDRDLADQVAKQLMRNDALGAHARDELGISPVLTARPIQAAITSAATYTAGALPPLALALLAPTPLVVPAVAAVSIILLIVLGMVGAKEGGANPARAVVRVTFWGVSAMLVTAGIGRLLGTII